MVQEKSIRGAVVDKKQYEPFDGAPITKLTRDELISMIEHLCSYEGRKTYMCTVNAQMYLNTKVLILQNELIIRTLKETIKEAPLDF